MGHVMGPRDGVAWGWEAWLLAGVCDAKGFLVAA